VYLIDTNVVSEARKQDKANQGVIAFFREVIANDEAIYLSVVTVGELRRGVELIRHRGDDQQAERLETWLLEVLDQYRDNILCFDADAAQVWGRLRVPHPEHELDTQVAAIALVNDLTVVTRNTADFATTGVKLRNPFLSA
jgi:toxin FitB